VVIQQATNSLAFSHHSARCADQFNRQENTIVQNLMVSFAMVVNDELSDRNNPYFPVAAYSNRAG